MKLSLLNLFKRESNPGQLGPEASMLITVLWHPLTHPQHSNVILRQLVLPIWTLSATFSFVCKKIWAKIWSWSSSEKNNWNENLFVALGLFWFSSKAVFYAKLLQSQPRSKLIWIFMTLNFRRENLASSSEKQRYENTKHRTETIS